MDVLPRDITVLPHVLGSDLIEYLTATSAATVITPGDWDPFAEAAGVIDPHLWYVTSRDSEKAREVRADARAVITGQESGAYASVSGTIILVDDRERVRSLWRDAW